MATKDSPFLQQCSVEAAECRRQYVDHWCWTCNLRLSSNIISRFPLRHSCRHCKERMMGALRYSYWTYLSGIDEAIKDASDGCTLYEWLLDFLILSYTRNSGPPKLVGREGFYVYSKCVISNVTNIHSLQFLIGIERYT